MQTTIKGGREKLLEALTYEVVDGKPIYYRGYKDVLEGKKQPEEVMASSVLQGKILALLVAYLLDKIKSKDYTITTGETGVKTKKGHRAVDIGVFKGNIYDETFAKISPIVAIEVDIKAELGDKTFMEYVEEKVKDLFEIGTRKVVWILTKPRIVMVFERGKEGRILTWDDEVEVLEGIKFRLSDLIQP